VGKNWVQSLCKAAYNLRVCAQGRYATQLLVEKLGRLHTAYQQAMHYASTTIKSSQFSVFSNQFLMKKTDN
jgi:hypothetical protein